MYSLLITDLDDTLYSWIDFFIPSFYDMIEKIEEITGISQDVLLSEFKQQHILLGSVEYPFAVLSLPSIAKHYSSLSIAEIKCELDPAFHKFNSTRKKTLKLFDGVEQTLSLLKENGIKIVGYTESAEENGFYRLKRLGIEPYFSAVYVSESRYQKESNYDQSEKIHVVKGKKPNPLIIDSILAQFNVHRENALYIGDSLTKDIYMAFKAGVKSVHVRINPPTREAYEKLVAISHWKSDDFENERKLKNECQACNIKPDYTITDFRDLKDIVIT